jgi:hypothetical protein
VNFEFTGLQEPTVLEMRDQQQVFAETVIRHPKGQIEMNERCVTEQLNLTDFHLFPYQLTDDNSQTPSSAASSGEVNT